MSKEQNNQHFGSLSDQLIVFMEKSSYQAATIKRYKKNIFTLSQRLTNKSTTVFNADICASLVADILNGRDYPSLKRSEKDLIRCANALIEYSISGYISFRSQKQPIKLQGEIGQLINKHVSNRLSIGLSERTEESTLLYLRRFQGYLGAIGVTDLRSLTSEHLLGYVMHLGFSTKSTIHCTLSSLRGFFKYLYEKSILDIDWSYALPRDNYKNEAKLPSTLDKDEISGIIQSVDRGNPKGKRDYAMVLLAAMLGLRASDICGLKFEQVLWEQNIIALVQAKTQKCIELPLLTEVGNAIITYLKHGRPHSEEPYIFLQHIHPYKKMKPPTLHSIIKELMNRAGIKGMPNRKHGPHALRHSLAGAMLENKTPLPVISEVLGHRNTESTMVYLKVDIQALEQCALDVPPLENDIYGEVRV